MHTAHQLAAAALRESPAHHPPRARPVPLSPSDSDSESPLSESRREPSSAVDSAAATSVITMGAAVAAGR